MVHDCEGSILVWDAAWYRTKIVHHQVSPELLGIFAFIKELYTCCSGGRAVLSAEFDIASQELDASLNTRLHFRLMLANPTFVFLGKDTVSRSLIKP
jgi:hypothetical protein